MDNWYYYNLYGLSICSEICIPDLETRGIYADGSNAVITAPSAQFSDVQIAMGSVDTDVFESATQWFCASSENHAVMRIPHVANFSIRNGAHICIDPHPGSELHQIILFLLGSAMGCLLHQRKLIPLHISAISINEHVWGFTAPSGTGKSTLAARLSHHEEVHLVSDDVAIIDLSYDQPMLVSGVPLVKVTPKLANRLCAPEHIRCNGTESGKVKAQPPGKFKRGSFPLAGVVWLNRTDSPKDSLEISKLVGASRFFAAQESLYRNYFAEALYSKKYLGQTLLMLAQKVSYYRGDLGPWGDDGTGLREREVIALLLSMIGFSQVG